MRFLLCLVLAASCGKASSLEQLVAAVRESPRSVAEADWKQRLAKGQTAAETLLKMDRPSKVSAAEWQQISDTSNRVLGWSLFLQKRLAEATPILEAYLRRNPGDAEVSYWLGQAAAVHLEKEADLARKQKRAELAIFHLTRAAVVDGEGALPEEGRVACSRFVRKFYTNVFETHGATGPLDRVVELAKKSALPPAGYSLGVVALRR